MFSQPSTSGTGAAEDDTSKSNLYISEPSSNTKHNMKPKNKLKILLSSFELVNTSKKLSSILKLYEDSGFLLNNEDFDKLQWGLESMLVSVLRRKNVIHNQLQMFNNLPHELTADNHLVFSKPMVVITSPKNNPAIDYEDVIKEEPLEEELEFWSFVKPYIDDINTEDIKWLMDKIESYSDINSYKIPHLGTHYMEKLVKKTVSPNLQIPHSVKNFMIEASKFVNSCNTSTPAHKQVMLSLTEYLHRVFDFEELLEDYDSDELPEMENIGTKFYSELNNDMLRKLGVLNNFSTCRSLSFNTSGENNQPEDHDEILDELVKCNNMLQQIQESNKKQLTDILGKCQEDYCRTFIKKKIKALDNKIINFKRKKNKSWTDEQKKDQIFKENNEMKHLLQQRSFYLSQLNSILKIRVNLVRLRNIDDLISYDEKTKNIKKDNNNKVKRNQGETKPCVKINLRDHKYIKTTEKGKYISTNKQIIKRGRGRPPNQKNKLRKTQQSNIETKLIKMKEPMNILSCSSKSISNVQQSIETSFKNDISIQNVSTDDEFKHINCSDKDTTESKLSPVNSHNLVDIDETQYVGPIISQDKNYKDESSTNVKAKLKVYSNNMVKEKKVCNSAKKVIVKQGCGRPPKPNHFLEKKKNNNKNLNQEIFTEQIVNNDKNDQNELETNVKINNIMVKNNTILTEGTSSVMVESMLKQIKQSPTSINISEKNLKLNDASDVTEETKIKCKNAKNYVNSFNSLEIDKLHFVYGSTSPCSSPLCSEYFTQDVDLKKVLLNKSDSKTDNDTEFAQAHK